MKDYIDSGISIQSAMLDMYKSYPDKATRPNHIIWGGKEVRTGYWIDVPHEFHLILSFLSAPDANQGADVKVESGYLKLVSGKEVKLLRTWHSPEYEPTVEYDGYSKTGRIFVCNVYIEERGGHSFEEKWTRNAGMIVELKEKGKYVFRCSPGEKSPPDFNSIVFTLNIENRA
ncbi:hypothetical protein [Microbulbifer hainanensis]|uniref:hypothetical protein n=1 Tax=Microbulbifer hainanensis TaxID=2735675 RepID=UPI00186954AC|nr:hypothetical protein [Microbulbifer hainanensis]